MKHKKLVTLLIIAGVFGAIPVNAQDGSMSFFVTSGSRGCSLDALAKTGGNGRFYCFATD